MSKGTEMIENHMVSEKCPIDYGDMEEALSCPECGATLDQDEALLMDDLYFCDDQCWGSWRQAAAEWRGEIDR